MYSLADKFANGILLFLLVAKYADDSTALGWIMAIVPTLSAVCCTIATYIGITLYAEKLAKISSGSMLKNVKNRQQQVQQHQQQSQEPENAKLLTSQE